MTHIDTAEMYGSGAAEQIVGEAIAGRRDEVFLVSKVLPQNASRRGTAGGLRTLAGQAEHRPARLLPAALAGTAPARGHLRRIRAARRPQGKILSWGVSNFDVADLEEASEIVQPGHIACNQVLYHLQERAIEHTVLPWCEKHGVAVVGYSPFGHGSFPGPRTSGGRVLQQIAAAHNATARQVALRFLVRRPSLFTIPKASSAQHAVENAGAGDLRLTAAELAQIDAAFPLGPRPRSLPML